MAIRMKKDGVWIGPVGDGRLAVKLGGYGGGYWQGLGGARVKIGPYGSGYWQPLGYQGYPNPPAAIWVHNWDNSGYSWIHFAWNWASGGPPVASYDCEMLDSNGNYIAAENGSTDNIAGFNVGPDWVVQARVRSVGANGLKSGWTYGGRGRMGHAATPNYGWVQHADYHSSEHLSGYRIKDDPFWVGILTGAHGGYVYIQGMHWRNLRFPSGQFVSPSNTPPNQRFVAWIVYSAEYGYIHQTYGNVYSGDNTDHPLGNWAQDTGGLPGYNWGIVARGTGWSTGNRPDLYALWCDDFWVDGTEYWNNYEIVSWNPAVGNSGW